MKTSVVSFVALFLMLTMGALLAWPNGILIASLIFLLSTIVTKQKNLLLCAVLFFLMFTSGYYFPSFLWNLPSVVFLVPLFLSILFVYPYHKEIFSWLRKGELDQITIAQMVITSGVSALALILWAYWSENLGAGISMMRGLIGFPAWLILIFAIPIFALVNALAEEFVYRGVIMEALESVFPNRMILVMFLQASAFAAAHVSGGFPNGWTGYLMTFVYALMLGWLRKRSHGLLAPYVTHVAADLVIGYYLYFQAA